METQVNPIPQGYHSLTPYLIVNNASKAIEFYKKAFNAREIFRMDGDKGKISHCELEIGDSRIMLADEFPEMGAVAPDKNRGHSAAILIYVTDANEIFQQAVDAGGKVIRQLKDEFYGDRMGTIEDPFGHNWHIGMHIEDVSPDEMKKRLQAKRNISEKH